MTRMQLLYQVNGLSLFDIFLPNSGALIHVSILLAVHLTSTDPA